MPACDAMKYLNAVSTSALVAVSSWLVGCSIGAANSPILEGTTTGLCADLAEVNEALVELGQLVPNAKSYFLRIPRRTGDTPGLVVADLDGNGFEDCAMLWSDSADGSLRLEIGFRTSVGLGRIWSESLGLNDGSVFIEKAESSLAKLPSLALSEAQRPADPCCPVAVRVVHFEKAARVIYVERSTLTLRSIQTND